MSFNLSSIVWDLNLPGSEKYILLALADFVNGKEAKKSGLWECWPTAEMIAGKCGISRASVFTHLKSLESRGIIQRRSSGVNKNSYVIKLSTVQNLDSGSLNSGLPERGKPSKIWTPVVQNLDSGSLNSGLPNIIKEPGSKPGSKPRKSIRAREENSLEVSPPAEPKKIAKPKIEKTKNKPSADPIVLPDWMPPEDWQDFVDNRKAIRKPMTDQAKRLMIAKLGRLKDEGENPVDLLKTSIINGWQGVFPEKQSRTANGPRSPANRESFMNQPSVRTSEEWHLGVDEDGNF